MTNDNAPKPNLEKYRLAARHLQTVGLLINGSAEQDDGCRVWTRARLASGYGVVHYQRQALLAHRLSYWVFHGPIEGELVVDHMCSNRSCVEPSHLRLLTREQNSAEAWPAKKTHCKRGHPLSGDNVSISVGRDGQRRRTCKACHRALGALRYAKRKAVAAVL
jgi:hypothetical protein